MPLVVLPIPLPIAVLKSLKAPIIPNIAVEVVYEEPFRKPLARSMYKKSQFQMTQYYPTNRNQNHLSNQFIPLVLYISWKQCGLMGDNVPMLEDTSVP